MTPNADLLKILHGTFGDEWFEPIGASITRLEDMHLTEEYFHTPYDLDRRRRAFKVEYRITIRQPESQEIG